MGVNSEGTPSLPSPGGSPLTLKDVGERQMEVTVMAKRADWEVRHGLGHFPATVAGTAAGLQAPLHPWELPLPSTHLWQSTDQNAHVPWAGRLCSGPSLLPSSPARQERAKGQREPPSVSDWAPSMGILGQDLGALL